MTIGTYDPWLVVLSMAVAVMASYVALDLASRVTASGPDAARRWLLAGAVSMGVGIWSMHFIAMLALRLPGGMSYDIPITGLSLLIAVTVSGFALHTVSRARLGRGRLFGAGVLMGIGIAAMHYTGMAAMNMSPAMRYDPGLFSLSIAVAIAVAIVALWLAFRLRGETLLSGFWRKAGSAMVMGAAICGMHYTGMAAAIFPPHPMAMTGDPATDSGWLAVTIGVFTMMLLLATLLVSLFDIRRMRDQYQTEELTETLRELQNSRRLLSEAQHLAQLGSWQWDIRSGEVSWSDELYRLFGLDPQQSPATFAGFIDGVHVDDRDRVRGEIDNALATQQPFQFEHRVTLPDGSVRTMQARGRVIADADADGGAIRMAGSAQDITERKEAERLLQQLAHFDPLTGLPNRRLFQESLLGAMAQADSQDCLVFLLFLDMDNFKDINDSLGHAVGDELLRQVGQRLLGCLRVRDTVGRLGGDEFGVILLAQSDPQLAVVVAEKIHAALRDPFEVEGHSITTTVSIGITVYPTDAADVHSLVRYVDMAMYEAKQAGRNAYRFYTAAMNVRASEKRDLVADLRDALEQHQFVLHYQPKVCLRSGRWTGVEALLRWNRPGHGLVAPAVFIDALEETGLIVPVGAWVVTQACRQLEAWRRSGFGPLPIAVNVSARQTAPDSLASAAGTRGPARTADVPVELWTATAACLYEHQVPPGQLEFELTESTLMSDAEYSIDLLRQLKGFGIRISIDDFGTGYSSLAYLRRFPLDAVKIDGSFIRDLPGDTEDASIALAIIGLAHRLNLQVVAECVETAGQLAFLRANGCDQAQGYLLARPMAVDALEALWHATGGISPAVAAAHAQPVHDRLPT